MLINRELRCALLLSLLGHVLVISLVSLVFLPKGFLVREYSAVSFLGSILRSSNLTVPAAVANQQLNELPIQLKSSKLELFGEQPGQTAFSDRELINPDALIDVDAPQEQPISFASRMTEEHLLPEREIIFQPDFPSYPEWLQQDFKAVQVAFKIYISDEGLVEQVINIQASGDSEIDAALARYIEKWRFAPNLGQPGQWQTVKINLQQPDAPEVSINPQPFDFTQEVLP